MAIEIKDSSYLTCVFVARRLRNFQVQYKLNTCKNVLARFEPIARLNSERLAREAATLLGVPFNAPVNLLDDAVMLALVIKAVALMEHKEPSPCIAKSAIIAAMTIGKQN